MWQPQRRAFWIGIVVIVLVLLAVDWRVDGITRLLILGAGTLTVTTEPTGALVSIDGQARGVTPIDVRVGAGHRIVRLQHRFHPDHVETLDVARGDRRALRVRLEPAVGTLALVSNPKGAAIVLDGERIARQTPTTLASVATGAHTVRFEMSDRRAVERSVDVLPGTVATLRVELERIVTGVLTVQTLPADAHVEIDGGGYAYEPGVALPLGAYHITVSAPGHTSVSVPVDVRSGRNLSSVTLARTFGTLVVSVEPVSAEVTVTYGDGPLERTLPYRGELRLPTGALRIHARAVNHRRYERRIDLGVDGARVAIRLERIDARAGDRIRDRLSNGAEGPAMIVVGPGEYILGAAPEREATAPRSTRRIRLRQPYAIGVYEVTRAEYAAFAAATGARLPEAAEHESEDHPIVHVDRDDAVAYAVWLSRETGERYRLPSEAEWEFAARAGGHGRFGELDEATDLCRYANLADASAAKLYRQWDTVACDDGHVRSAPIGSYLANAFGVHDMLGNVGEWVLDCWFSGFDDVPSDGGPRSGECVSYVVRGGSSDSPVDGVRVTSREPSSQGADDRGFRLVREL